MTNNHSIIRTLFSLFGVFLLWAISSKDLTPFEVMTTYFLSSIVYDIRYKSKQI
jgi:hypothetical protein